MVGPGRSHRRACDSGRKLGTGRSVGSGRGPGNGAYHGRPIIPRAGCNLLWINDLSSGAFRIGILSIDLDIRLNVRLDLGLDRVPPADVSHSHRRAHRRGLP